MDTILKIENVSKTYTGHKALDNVSMEIERGTIYGLLGPNGAGKTTLIRIINRITLPDCGKVMLNGREITSEDMPGWLVATEGTLTVALDIVQTPELIREGTARELIHPIQNLRKESGFDVTDRINTVIYASGAAFETIQAALAEHKEYVAAQTLSINLELKDATDVPENASAIEWEDTRIFITVNRI